jgi:hypothetical protein
LGVIAALLFGRPGRRQGAAAATNADAASTIQPGEPFDCDTPRASAWFGSTARCLAELCRGRNVTNAAVLGGDGRLRPNPCAGGSDDRR